MYTLILTMYKKPQLDVGFFFSSFFPLPLPKGRRSYWSNKAKSFLLGSFDMLVRIFKYLVFCCPARLSFAFVYVCVYGIWFYQIPFHPYRNHYLKYVFSIVSGIKGKMTPHKKKKQTAIDIKNDANILWFFEYLSNFQPLIQWLYELPSIFFSYLSKNETCKWFFIQIVHLVQWFRNCRFRWAKKKKKKTNGNLILTDCTDEV